MFCHGLAEAQFTLRGVPQVTPATDEPNFRMTKLQSVLRHRARAAVIVDIDVTNAC